MKTLESARVTRNRQIRPGIWSMWVHAPEIAAGTVPGQFVHVRVKRSWQPLLRRPLSIGRVHGSELELVWRVVGEGTELLTHPEEGDEVDLLGPLGYGFQVPEGLAEAVLVGGGLGLPPLVYLSEELDARGIRAHLLLGVRGDDDIPLADDDPILQRTEVVAESGGRWRAGLVTEPTREHLDRMASDGRQEDHALYACGPWGMVGALQRSVGRDEVGLAQVSLEQHMGCAVGVCQGCAVVAEGGPTPYRLVCHDGPVFDLFGVEVPHAR